MANDKTLPALMDSAKAAIKPDGDPIKVTKMPPTWLGKHPLLDQRHAHDLEQAAAINEFHHKMPRDQAEAAAHDEYRKTHHTAAAAHHFAGVRAAQGAGDMEEAKKHGDLYAQHMKALGHDPYGPVPEHIRLQAADPQHTKVYRFANHGGDQFLGQALGKSAVEKGDVIQFPGNKQKARTCPDCDEGQHDHRDDPIENCDCECHDQPTASISRLPRSTRTTKSERPEPKDAPKCRQCGEPFKNPVDAMVSSGHNVCGDCAKKNHAKVLGKTERLLKLAKMVLKLRAAHVKTGG